MTAWEAAKLADTLTVAQAACCIFGVPPASLGGNTSTDPYLYSPFNDEYDEDSAVFSTIVSALNNAINAKTLVPMSTSFTQSGGVDLWKTLVRVNELKDWLLSRNCRPWFFFPEDKEPTGKPDYLNPKHPRYSAKLAAAVSAWEAMQDENLMRGKTPKRAMAEWMETRYQEFGLIHQQDSDANGYRKGDRNDGAITQAAEVANWLTKGGTPKTPSGTNLPPTKA